MMCAIGICITAIGIAAIDNGMVPPTACRVLQQKNNAAARPLATPWLKLSRCLLTQSLLECCCLPCTWLQKPHNARQCTTHQVPAAVRSKPPHQVLDSGANHSVCQWHQLQQQVAVCCVTAFHSSCRPPLHSQQERLLITVNTTALLYSQ